MKTGELDVPINISEFTKTLNPKNTVILFGAGASIPSGAPSSSQIKKDLCSKFNIDEKNYSLSEVASFTERAAGRPKLISAIRQLLQSLKPTGGLRNLPLYPWKSIFTTNYDDLVEQAYKLKGRSVRVYHCAFDFQECDDEFDAVLFKLHGTIDHDIADGHKSRLIITEQDYDQTSKYRDFLYDRFKGDLAGSNLVIIGQSLADPDIKSIINRSADLNAEVLSPARICLLMFERDDERASLYENRGISVAFGSIDDFFASLAPSSTATSSTHEFISHLDAVPHLQPTTIDVAHAIGLRSDISGMVNGRPAEYADINVGRTFARSVVDSVINYFKEDGALCAVLLGASGVGKTTAARQVAVKLLAEKFYCYEHKSDHSLSVKHWLEVADFLREAKTVGLLIIDDAHTQLQQINELVDDLVKRGNGHLKLLLCSSRNHWHPRIKTPNIFHYGKQFGLSQLNSPEIESLLDLVDRDTDLKALIEDQFSGFNREERRRRLAIRCEADMFVCLKNIFATDSFDVIVLKEFAELDEPLQDVYRYVAAMESAGIRVHRQLVIRLLGIGASKVLAVLENLTDIISEYDVSPNIGIYGWRTRHAVIASIITKYKFSDLAKRIALFERVIKGISPTYDIEIRSLRELCNLERGIPSIPDKSVQNHLLRMMMSSAPGERVPRHRLIRNLIDQDAFPQAETEIKIFEKDFGADGPVHRYKVKLLLARATRAKGIMKEDRLTMLGEAQELAEEGIRRYSTNKNMLATYAEVGLEFVRMTGNYEVFDRAMEQLKRAEEELGDPQVSQIIARFQSRISGKADSESLLEDD